MSRPQNAAAIFRNLMDMPPEIRRMIYKEAIGEGHHPTFWISPEISRDAQTFFRQNYHIDLAYDAHRALRTPPKREDLTLEAFFGRSITSWLRAGMGEIFRLNIQCNGRPVLQIILRPDQLDYAAIIACRFWSTRKMAETPGITRDYKYLWFTMGMNKTEKKEFVTSLTAKLRESITSRGGHGLGMPELQLIWDTVWSDDWSPRALAEAGWSDGLVMENYRDCSSKWHYSSITAAR